MKTIDSILKPLQKALQKAEAIEEHNAAESKRFLDEDDTNVCA